MAWITPKTDWNSGDVFTVEDYNRIRGNYIEVNNKISRDYSPETIDFGAAASIATMYTASQFNVFEQAIDSFRARTGRDLSVGTRQDMKPNGVFATPDELNRLEQTALNYYEWNVAVMGIRLNKNVADITVAEQLTYEIYPGDATNKSVRWESSDTSVAVVDQLGNVTPIAVGECTITVTTDDGGYSDTCYVAVVIPVTSVTVSPASFTEEVGYTKQLTATVYPSNAGNKNIRWSSSDESVATVDENGLVTCHAVGDCTITVTTVDGGFTSECAATVVAEVRRPDRMELTLDDTAYKGRLFTIRVKVYPVIDNKENEWWLTRPDGEVLETKLKVRNWEDKGEHMEGTITTTINALGAYGFACVLEQPKRDHTIVRASINVNVQPVMPEQIIIEPERLTGGVGGTYRLTARFIPEDVTDTRVAWESSDTSIVSLASSAYTFADATLVTTGTATVTVKSSADKTVTDSIQCSGKEAGTRYNGEVINWFAMPNKKIDGMIPLVSYDILSIKDIDAIEQSNQTVCAEKGNDHIAHSNLLQWANTARGSWYMPQHEFDAPPTIGLVKYPYDEEAGFLDGFSSNMLSAMQWHEMEYSYRQHHLRDANYLKSEPVMAKVHVPASSDIDPVFASSATAIARQKAGITAQLSKWITRSLGTASSGTLLSSVMLKDSSSSVGAAPSFINATAAYIGGFRPFIWLKASDIHLIARAQSNVYDIDWTGESSVTLDSITGNYAQIYDTTGAPSTPYGYGEIFFETRSKAIKTGDGASQIVRLYGYPSSVNVASATLSTPTNVTAIKGASGIIGDKSYVDIRLVWQTVGDDKLVATVGNMKAMVAVHVEATPSDGDGTSFYDEFIRWQVLEHGHDGDGVTTLQTEKVVAARHFDSQESNEGGLDRTKYCGNTRYSESNILQWLNADGDTWFTPQSPTDVSPFAQGASYVSGSTEVDYSAYADNPKGVLRGFSADLKAAMIEVEKDVPYVTNPLEYMAGEGIQFANESVTRKVHLPSNNETSPKAPSNASPLSNPTYRVYEGTTTKYAYYAGVPGTIYAQTKPTTLGFLLKEDIAKLAIDYGVSEAAAMSWVTRSVFATTSGARALGVSPTGYSVTGSGSNLKYAPAPGVPAARYSIGAGIAPLIFLSSSLHVFDEPYDGDAYAIDWDGVSGTTIGDLPVGAIIVDYGRVSGVSDPKLNSIEAVTDLRLTGNVNYLRFSVTPKNSVASSDFTFAWSISGVNITNTSYQNGLLTLTVNCTNTSVETAVLTISAKGKSFSFDISIERPVTLRLEDQDGQSSGTRDAGAELMLTCYADNVLSGKPTITSSNTSVVAVTSSYSFNQYGDGSYCWINCDCVGAGTATITVEKDGATTSYTVTVNAQPLDYGLYLYNPEKPGQNVWSYNVTSQPDYWIDNVWIYAPDGKVGMELPKFTSTDHYTAYLVRHGNWRMVDGVWACPLLLYWAMDANGSADITGYVDGQSVSVTVTVQSH